MGSRSRWMSPRCTSTSGMRSSRRAATPPRTNDASWEEDLQESMDNCQRSGVSLSARGLDSCAAHQALPVSLLIEDVVNEQRLGQRTYDISCTAYTRILNIPPAQTMEPMMRSE